MVPSIPTRSVLREDAAQGFCSLRLDNTDAMMSPPRYTTATPRLTQRNAVPTVIMPDICKNAVTMPMIALTISANVGQLDLQFELNIAFITSHINICRIKGKCDSANAMLQYRII